MKQEITFEDIPGDPDNVLLTFPIDLMKELKWEINDTLNIEVKDGALYVSNLTLENRVNKSHTNSI